MSKDMTKNKDSVIVSFPRSGRTWLTTMIGLAICYRDGISAEEASKERIKRVDATHDKTDKGLKLLPEELSTSKHGYKDKHVLFLMRDPKDQVLSAYLHAKKNKGYFTGTLSEYIRDRRYGVEKIITFANNWYDQQHVPKTFYPMWYEEMKRYPYECLAQAFRQFKICIFPANIESAVEQASLEQLQAWEREGFLNRGVPKPKHPEDPESYYHRKGIVGDYKNHMTQDDIDFCDEWIAKMKFTR